MCGIAGFLSTNDAVPDPSVLARMCDAIVHRGPDAPGYFVDNHVALGNRRLRIIDVEGGDQPIGNEDGSIQVVFNGEIYNYRELRAELLGKGHHLATQCDTEVLAHLYEEVGERVPEYLNGMFAFAIWDSRRRTLFLARDRFGEKPLYYTQSLRGMQFCFASELKAMVAVPGFDPAINHRSVADFLALAYVPDPGTIYENVFKLSPGHSLTVTPTRCSLRRYWVPEFAADESQDLDTVVEELRDLASDAVERRMISDVPLGAFLSGGVDSSTVVACMARKAPDHVKTFSIGFTNKDFDELEFARRLVSRYKTEHHEQVVSASVHEMLGTLAEHFDEPFGDPSAVPMLYLARMTRQHVTVALSGDGADELFGGYRRHRTGMLGGRLRTAMSSWFSDSTIQRVGRGLYNHAPRGTALWLTLAEQLEGAYFTSMSSLRDGALQAVLSAETRHAIGAYSPRSRFRDLFGAVRHLSPLQQIQWVDWHTYLPGDILVKVDRTTMAYSLESRAPWLDHRLAELACRLPDRLKVNGGIGKYVFKQAAAPMVPGSLVTRTKMGFGVPLAEWFRTSLRGTFDSLVLQPEMEKYLSLPGVRVLWHEHQFEGRDHSTKLWNLLMLALWDKRWRTSSRSDLLTDAEALSA